MKKILSLVLAVIMCFAVATTLISCGHEHEYKTEWSSDATNHWHDCTDPDCTEPADKAAHSWDAGTVKSFVDTEYACTVCGYKKTVSANTVVSATQWTAAMDLGENYTIYAKQFYPGEGSEVFVAKRAGNLFAFISEMYEEGETEASDVSYDYGKIDGEVYYNYYPQYDQNEQFIGYRVEASSQTVQENLDEVLGEFVPEPLRDMTKYTHNTTTGYYECAEMEYYGMTIQNIKLGFKEGKLVYGWFELAIGDGEAPSIAMDITYGGATVTLPTEDQIITQN
ncbi:MAG: hypothetical protein IKA06_02500 [Clostridia bacterium]|nr:hypothetical protein [Clostridia bacterium]